MVGFNVAPSTYNAASGTQTVMQIQGAINTSGTASTNVLLINPTYTTTGSGTNSLIEAQRGGSLVARLLGTDPGATGAILSLFTSGTQRLSFGMTSGFSAIYAGTIGTFSYRWATNDTDIIYNAGAGGFHNFSANAGGTVLAISGNGRITNYSAVATAGWGVPAIYAAGRSTAQTAAVASVATYTNTAADGTYEVSANVLVTTSTTHAFTVTCSYTDEGNTARTVTMSFSLLAGGAMTTSVANANGAVPYMGIPLIIRSRASTAITIATTGTFTTVTYNVEGFIKRLS